MVSRSDKLLKSSRQCLREANQIGQSGIFFFEKWRCVVVVDNNRRGPVPEEPGQVYPSKVGERDGDCLDCCSDDGGLVLSCVELFETYLTSCSARLAL
jgi:hypothetical protein